MFTKFQRVYFIVCQLHVALRPRLFCSLLGVVGRDTRRGVAERAPCRRTSFPRPSRSIRCGEPRHVAYCSESTVQFVFVMEYVAVVVQQSTASVLTCSDSKTRSQHGFLHCFLSLVTCLSRCRLGRFHLSWRPCVGPHTFARFLAVCA